MSTNFFSQDEILYCKVFCKFSNKFKIKQKSNQIKDGEKKLDPC